MDSKYNHNICENVENLYNKKNDLYKNKNVKNNKNFTIILPPPNVTGELHLGHAWNCIIQDIFIRYKNILGYNILWISGMDHAGIATQVKYEKFLSSNNQNVMDLKKNREFFFNELYKWKDTNATSIREQWKKLGLSLDYKNEYFTLDQESSKSVMDAFVFFYNKKLIYREKKLVNWDVSLKTAISNIEVINNVCLTKMFYIKYFFKNSDEYIPVATTRPETIFVDECLFVNPKDERYKKFINKIVVNPLTKKEISILSDSYVDINFGSGVMKCTPAHDFNDFELAKKYNLNAISCMNEDGKLNELCEDFVNIDRIIARKKIVNFLKEKNLFIKEEEIESNIGLSERTNEIVEPFLSLQWFFKVSSLNKKILEIQQGKNGIKLFPDKFNKNLINWLKNMQDWCISRQLIWGHQIPVWYKSDNLKELYVGINKPNGDKWVRDKDVLDTWFSSGLLPITLSSYKNFNLKIPTSLLVTGYDIIFFWIARMLIFAIFLKGKIPFKNVYITGLIRDPNGKKMSKSLGNGINPNDIINKYGADSLRLFLSMSSPGEDLKFSYEKLEFCWKFLNKFWNLIRFIFLDNDLPIEQKIDIKKCDFLDKWILTKYYESFLYYKMNFNKFNLFLGIKKIIDFIWNDLCNIYLEFTKNKTKEKNKNVYAIFIFLVKNCLILLNPVCPYFTIYIYEKFFSSTKPIHFEKLSSKKYLYKNDVANNFIDLIHLARKFRIENNLSKKEIININIAFLNIDILKKMNKKLEEINFLLINENIKVNNMFFLEEQKKINFNKNYSTDLFFAIFSKDLIRNKINIDLDKIKKEILFLDKEIKRCDLMLSNISFLKKAPKEKIKLEEDKREKYINKKKELEKFFIK